MTTFTSPHVSIGIIAWNEEKCIAAMLNSIFEQSLFAELGRRGQRCEIVVVANGCTDRTVEIASELFLTQSHKHPEAPVFSARVMNVAERGKISSWNRFVHAFSARDSKFLFLMDADILIRSRDTLWNMLRALEGNSGANISVDWPRKDIEFKSRRSLAERLSLATSRMTGAASAQLCGQLYCIRAEIARNIFLPRDLCACDDGFIKALVCTDFLTHRVWTSRIVTAENATHTFEAYVSATGILKNQKRQMIGQTIVHILIDCYLKNLPPERRAKLAETLRETERGNPNWLKQLIAQHMRRTKFFWQLYPGLVSHRFKRLTGLGFAKRIACIPAALAGAAIALVSSFLAYESLKKGATNYWPRIERTGFKELELSEQAAAQR